MRSLRLRFSLVILLSFLLVVAPLGAQTKKPAPPKIKLVLGIVIDQFRYDYLTRFEDQFGEGGFKRFLQGGAVFTNAHYPYTPTVTACGHAVFMTGSLPSENGIIANEWWDRESGKRITSVVDANTKLLGGKEAEGSSPRRLLSSTIGDQLKLTTAGQAKVIGVSLKDRAAILPAGHKANGAYWYDDTTGRIVSSTYYFNDLPAWVKQFNQDNCADKYFGKKWEKLLPDAAYARSLPDDSPFEKWAYGKTFPHIITGGEDKPGSKFFKQFEGTPFANEMLVNLAKAAIENEQLGQDDVPDVLTVSFSANDILGHAVGPNSPEAQDITLRTDRLLAEFLAYVDKKVGLQNTVIAFTADHGVAPVPEHAQSLGLGGRMETKDVTDAINNALNKRFGEEKWVSLFTYGNVFFDYAALAHRKASHVEVEQIASEAVLKLKGMAEAFTRTDILAGRLPRTRIANSVALGFNAERNGDLVLVPKPFWLFGEAGPLATTHGTPYSYDTHVPVIFYGAGIKAGLFTTPSSPLDIAPTLAAVLKIEQPSNVAGQILAEALKK
ncbi:MAG: alkaline phosphatase family protein [Blastocatellia bacterium]